MLWLLLSCSDVCLGSPLVVAWCYSLGVLRSYYQFIVRAPVELRRALRAPLEF